jgi:hypothetical protein
MVGGGVFQTSRSADSFLVGAIGRLGTSAREVHPVRRVEHDPGRPASLIFDPPASCRNAASRKSCPEPEWSPPEYRYV